MQLDNGWRTRSPLTELLIIPYESKLRIYKATNRPSTCHSLSSSCLACPDSRSWPDGRKEPGEASTQVSDHCGCRLRFVFRMKFEDGTEFSLLMDWLEITKKDWPSHASTAGRPWYDRKRGREGGNEGNAICVAMERRNERRVVPRRVFHAEQIGLTRAGLGGEGGGDEQRRGSSAVSENN